tara:strand:- start:390 stop:737 length:348 start_codon:yes stop_codon:yes gene_type:complete
MDNLYTKVKLYLDANSKSIDEELDNMVMRDDGAGAFIETWNVSGLAKPSDSQLNSYSSSVAAEEAKEVVRNTRKRSYSSVGNQLDLLYHDMTAGKLDATGEWHKSIKAIKDANPK